MKKYEKLKSTEILLNNNSENLPDDSTLTLVQVEQTFESLNKMFLFVAEHISVHLRSIIYEKINNEKNMLLEIIKDETFKRNIIKSLKKTGHILDDKYFTNVPLDITFF